MHRSKSFTIVTLHVRMLFLFARNFFLLLLLLLLLLHAISDVILKWDIFYNKYYCIIQKNTYFVLEFTNMSSSKRKLFE